MGDALVAIGGALVVAGLLGRGGRRIGLPTIPLFMLAGLALGPHTPGLDLVHDPAELELLASLGLVLLLFSLGLEFSIDDLFDGGRSLLAASAVFLTGNVVAALAFGCALGWGTREAFVIAGALAISSSAIVTKLLVEFGRLANPETRMILGIIVVEDLFLALALALLQPVLQGDQGALDAVVSIAAAFGFLLAFALLARHGGRVVSRLVASDDSELVTICVVGLAVLAAGLAEEFGVSEAIGAFLMGLMLAGSRSRERIVHLVLPIRDAFGALFFFAFGVTIDLGDVASVAAPITIAVALTTAVSLAGGLLVARINGWASPAGANIALTVLARGEFSLIIAALAT